MRDALGVRHLRSVPDVGSQPWSAASELVPCGPTPAGQLEPDDRDLARRLSRVKLASVDTAVWRHLSPYEQPRPDSGEAARRTGGRFNPPCSFPVVYGSLRWVTAGAEFRMLAQRHSIGPEKLLPRHVYRFRLNSIKVLDLGQLSIRDAVGLPPTGLATAVPRSFGG